MTANTTTIPNYPPAIRDSLVALILDPRLQQMPEGMVYTLAALVTKINQNTPFSPIYAKREKLAQDSGKSIKTINRHLAWLEKNGYIEQRVRQARNNLRGSDSPIVVTPLLIDVIGLPRHKELHSARRKAVVINLEAPEVTRTKFTKRGDCRIPLDLAWLVDRNGLAPRALCKLMKLAKTHGKVLSDVVSAAAKYLHELKGNRLFAYLSALCKRDIDFRSIVDSEAKERQSKQLKQRLAEKRDALVGRSFVSKKGTTAVVHPGGVMYLIKDGVQLGTIILNEEWLTQYDDGYWRQVA